MPEENWQAWFGRVLKPPTVSGDDEKQAVLRLLYYWTLIVMVTVIILLIDLMGPEKIQQPNPKRLSAIIAIAGLLAAFFLIRVGRVTLVIFIHIFIGWQLLLPSLLATGGIQSPGFSVLYVMLLFAGLFIGMRSVFVVAGLCSLFGLGLVWLQNNGYVVPAGTNPMVDWAAHTIYLALGALLLNLTNRSVRDSLRRTRHELMDRKRTEEALRSANERLAFLHQVDQAILSVQSVDAVARAVAQRIKNLVKCDRVAVVSLDLARHTSRLLSVVGIEPLRIVTGLDSKIREQGIMDRLMHERWFTREDLLKEPNLPQIDNDLMQAGFQSYVVFPLVADGALIGVVNIASKNLSFYVGEQMELVREMCDTLALAMQQAILHEQVQEYTFGLEQRVSERTAQLQASNQELEAFAYSISHDLRAPLRSIDGFSHALAEDYGQVLDSDAHDYLRRIRAGSQRMGQLIEDLLKLSRITRSEMQLDTVDLAQMAREIRLDLETSSPDRQVTWHLPDSLPVRADPNLLRILLTNLISNAWKFTSAKEHAIIEVGMGSEIGRQVFFIRDNGVGFDMKYAGKLFNAFQRLHAHDEFEGLGIGLAIAQRVVRRHGGEIWVEAAVDRGATIFFTLAPQEKGQPK